MSGIFSILSDGQSSLFRLQQARRSAGGAGVGTSGTGADATAKSGGQHLADLLKQGAASGSSGLSDYMRNASSAMTAMEQAQRIGNPKAHAEERLQDAERRIRDLKAEMRMAIARGDRDKAMKLAREAAAMAKQVGQAAKDYGRGMAAAAEMGLGGGAGLSSQTQTTTTSVTTVTMAQTTTTVTVTATMDGAGADAGSADAGGVIPGGADAAAVSAAPVAVPVAVPDTPPPPPPLSSEAGATGLPSAEGASTGKGSVSADPTSRNDDEKKQGEDLAATINAAMAALGGDAASGTRTGNSPSSTGNPFQSQVTDNALRMSRYREADTFARRVEAVLAAIKNVLGEAKVSNDYDPDQTRRKDRREELKEYDKVVGEADKAVNELRSSAFGTPSAAAGAGVNVAAAVATDGATMPVATGGATVNLVT